MMNLHTKKAKVIIAAVAIVLCLAMIIPFLVSMFYLSQCRSNVSHAKIFVCSLIVGDEPVSDDEKEIPLWERN